MTKEREFETFVEQVADRYRAEGYDVLVHPQMRKRPAFLRDFSPDLIAKRGKENAVVEIKRMDRHPVGASRGRMAKLVKSKPGWRLDLVIFSPKETGDVRTLPEKAIRDSIGRAKKLFGQGEKSAAFLLAWSAFEAAGRRAVEAIEQEPFENASPADLSKALLSLGEITEPQWRSLRDLLKVRNSVAHGGLDISIRKRDFDKICGLAERLISARSAVSTSV